MKMDRARQGWKARLLARLHEGPKLLILPNVWDPIGARLLESLGYPAVATASMALAVSLGFDDGERIRFDVLVDTIQRIAATVDVPVSADIERGYADNPEGVRENVRHLIQSRAVGINIEDSREDEATLRPVDEQCARIAAARAAAVDEGIPIVINARIDTFMGGMTGTKDELLDETIARARAYLAAGADCVYPITLGDLASLVKLRDAIDGAPINVYAAKDAAPLRDLEAAGIRRVSVGPGFLKVALTAMKQAAEGLLNYGSYDAFTEGVLSSDELRELIRMGRKI